MGGNSKHVWPASNMALTHKQTHAHTRIPDSHPRTDVTAKPPIIWSHISEQRVWSDQTYIISNMEGNYWCWQLTHSRTLSVKCYTPSSTPVHPSPPLGNVYFSPFPLLFLSILTSPYPWSTLPALPASSSLLHPSASLCSDTLLSPQTACRQLADGGRKGHAPDSRASALPHVHTGVKKKKTHTNVERKDQDLPSHLLFSLDLLLSLSVCVPPDCSHTVSLARISPPPPSFFLLLLLWLLLSQTCCREVSASSPLFRCLSQPLPSSPFLPLTSLMLFLATASVDEGLL